MLFAIFVLAVVMAFAYQHARRRSLQKSRGTKSSKYRSPSTANFWRTGKGRFLQAYLLIGFVVLLFFEEPVLDYHWLILICCFTLAGTSTYYVVRYTRKLAIRTRKPLILQAILFFGFSLLVIGWPFLRIVSIVANSVEGSSSAQVMVLRSYERSGPGNTSCGYYLRLEQRNDGKKYYLCADLVEFRGLSKSELLDMQRYPSGVSVEVNTKESFGVRLVQRVAKT
jgi:hypothetical protein